MLCITKNDIRWFLATATAGPRLFDPQKEGRRRREGGLTPRRREGHPHDKHNSIALVSVLKKLSLLHLKLLFSCLPASPSCLPAPLCTPPAQPLFGCRQHPPLHSAHISMAESVHMSICVCVCGGGQGGRRSCSAFTSTSCSNSNYMACSSCHHTCFMHCVTVLPSQPSALTFLLVISRKGRRTTAAADPSSSSSSSCLLSLVSVRWWKHPGDSTEPLLLPCCHRCSVPATAAATSAATAAACWQAYAAEAVCACWHQQWAKVVDRWLLLQGTVE